MVVILRLRRQMFGDAALGETNLAMIAAARSVGAAAKFTGSGGAIVALCPQGAEQEQRLQGKQKQGGRQAKGGGPCARRGQWLALEQFFCNLDVEGQ